jgi:hypothetical protein
MIKLFSCLAIVGLLGGCSRGLSLRPDAGSEGLGASSDASAVSSKDADGAGSADTTNAADTSNTADTLTKTDISNAADASNANDFVRPDGGIAPPMPEMDPAQIDNPTGTRLVQLVVGGPVLAVFEDGSVYSWDYIANDQLELEQTYPVKLTGLDGTVQIDVWTVLAETGTVGYWNYGPNYVRVVVQQIPDVERAISLSQGCALIADGSVRCWDEPRNNLYIRIPPDHAGVKMDVPPAVEVASNFHSRCTLVRDQAGTVTRFRPALLGTTLQAIEVSALTLPSPAHRLFDGCAIPDSGAPKCLWAGTIGQETVNATCSEAQEFDVIASGSERLTLASLGGNLRGCAVGESGQIYVTLTQPDPGSSTINMDPLPGVSQAVFARAGEYVSCAVAPPNIVCWAHEGLNAFKPMPVKFSMY